jgi:hypothetical protein
MTRNFRPSSLRPFAPNHGALGWRIRKRMPRYKQLGAIVLTGVSDHM